MDFSPQSRTAVEYALVLAEHFSAVAQLLHVFRPTAVSSTWERLPELHDLERTRAREELKRYMTAVERRGVAVLARLEEGDPADTIVEVAQEGFDLIVMGTHGRTGLSRLLHRHIAEKVVRLAPCPVVTLRVPEEPTEEASVETLPAVEFGPPGVPAR